MPNTTGTRQKEAQQKQGTSWEQSWALPLQDPIIALLSAGLCYISPIAGCSPSDMATCRYPVSKKEKGERDREEGRKTDRLKGNHSYSIQATLNPRGRPPVTGDHSWSPHLALQNRFLNQCSALRGSCSCSSLRIHLCQDHEKDLGFHDFRLSCPFIKWGGTPVVCVPPFSPCAENPYQNPVHVS